MKVMLVFPRLTDNPDPFSANSFLSSVMRPFWGLGKSNMVPPLSLLMIAAATPCDIDVRFIDERFEEIDFDEEVDLVGITVVTKAAPRVYQIADEFRRRDVAVVLGGIHPSVLPQEASLHADAVVIGEGEKVWPQILNDLKGERLRRFYKGGHQTDPNELPWPRRDVIPQPERYLTTKVITATRGCENSCTFCSNGLAIGKRYRTRDVQNVVDEIESMPGDFVYFADDNLGWDITHAKKLFRNLIPLNIKWIGAVTVSALEDIELVDLMAESGCITLDLGFESISPRVIAAIKKHRTNDPSRYRELIDRVHSHGIPIFGNFIFGFDDDDKSVFRQLIDFVNETCIEMPSFNVLIPYPGTGIYRQFEKEGRLFHQDWSYYDDTAACVVYQPRQMTAEELLEGYLMVTEEIHTPGSFLRRVIGAKTLRPVGIVLGFHYNLQKRASIRAGMPKMKRALQSSSPMSKM